MKKIQLFKKRALLVAGAVAGCFAGSAVASSPPTPPIMPTAPVLPAFQMETASFYDTGSIISGTITHSDNLKLVPAQFSTGGYVQLRSPSGIYPAAAAAQASILGSSVYIIAPQDSARVGYFVAIDETGAGGSSGNYTVTTTYTPTAIPNPLAGNVTVGALVQSNYDNPLNITSSVTVVAGSANYASGSVGYDPYGGPLVNPYVYYSKPYPGVMIVGQYGYSFLKISSGGTLNTLANYKLLLASAGQGLRAGAFIGGDGSYAFNYPAPVAFTYGPPEGGLSVATPSAFLQLGGPSTGYGVMNVDGGTWNDSNSPIFVGYGSQGFVTVQNSGTINLTSSAMIVGEDSSGLPTTNYDSLPVQMLAAGVGTVVVESGGTLTLTGSGGYIALGRSVSSSGATGSLYVSGTGSTVNVSQGILIGDGGTGLMNILAGARVTSGSSYAAGQAATYGLTSQTGGGTITIDGKTSTWDITGKGDFGETGTATMTAQNSGNLDITGALTLGDQSAGNGTLLVQSQGTVESGNATLGNQAGAIGTATVTGLNSSWTVDGTMTIGDYGTGSLFLNNNAMLTTTGNATLGSQAASTGTATASDAGTEWQINGELKVGDNGSATMLVENGSYISLAGNLAIADTAINSTGTLTLDGNGSRIIGNGTSVTIGGQGTGSMIVRNAADATFSGASVSLGEKQGGSGTLTVQDGNTLMSVGSLTVGSGGTGIFNLLNSASFSTATSVTLGENATGIGTATIDHATMTDANILTVGGSGTGTLNIQNGGSLTVQGNGLAIGEKAGSSGTLSLSGSGSTLTYSGDITVGSYGSGVFAAQTGGQFTGTSMALGENSGASGGLNIIGAGSSVKLSKDLTVGGQGVGLLTITSGGILSTQGDVTLAGKAGSNATLSIDGDSSGLTAPNLNIGGSGSKMGGAASVKLTNAGHLNIAQKITMWKGSSINTTNGTITVGTTRSAAEGYLTINSTGELAASGTITGNVSNDGGTISIGAGKPGTLNITGNFSQSAGILKVAMSGTSSSDASQLDATGTVAITGGTIEFDFVNGYAPKKGDTFQFIDPPQSVNLSNVDYTFTGLEPGFLFDVTPNTNGLSFTALNNAVATPEPAGLAIFGLGAGLVVLRRRRTHRIANHH